MLSGTPITTEWLAKSPFNKIHSRHDRHDDWILSFLDDKGFEIIKRLPNDSNYTVYVSTKEPVKVSYIEELREIFKSFYPNKEVPF